MEEVSEQMPCMERSKMKNEGNSWPIGHVRMRAGVFPTLSLIIATVISDSEAVISVSSNETD